MKTLNNNIFRMDDLGKKVTLYGWVSIKRKLGGLTFIDLRDRTGIIQLVFKEDNKYLKEAENLKKESVVKVEGIIKERESKNKDLATGDIEVDVTSLEVLSSSLDLPFEIVDNPSSNEETRLKYRYLDLRRKPLRENLMLRHKIYMIIRNYLTKEGFIEVETPILSKATPEGARDYLVPSRIYNGSFYALPQSPQIYKQLLMIGGIEKYYQIAKCFRDEDLRSDRQPEFTQLDLEMSFIEENDIFHVVENVMKEIFKEVKNITDLAFPRMTWKEAIESYGSDKPDLRFAMKINDLSSIFGDSNFKIFKDVLKEHGIINGLVVKGGSNKLGAGEIKKLEKIAKDFKAHGLIELRIANLDFTGGIAKFLKEAEKERLFKELKLEENDTLLIVAGKEKVVKYSLGAVRKALGEELDLKEKDYQFVWITEFPMYEYDEETDTYSPAHHPFTSPLQEDIDKMLTDKLHCRSRAYDLVLNGFELLSGSIRIHNKELQQKVFDAIGLSEEEQQAKFGFFLEAFKYGAPPHGGIGLGLDRLIMILAGTDNIKDVIAFPKTASAYDLMSDSPSKVGTDQLDELGIKLKE